MILEFWWKIVGYKFCVYFLELIDVILMLGYLILDYVILLLFNEIFLFYVKLFDL